MPEETSVDITQAHASRHLDAGALEALVRRTAQAEGFVVRSLGIVLADRATVHRLNREFLDHDYPTDVLSFSLDEDAAAEGILDGEVYVDLDMAAERAPEFGVTAEEEAQRYVLHGVLHLMGYDDAADAERAAMRRLEDRYLGAEERKKGRVEEE
ncbi:MAG: rRNA maturation RNase YbeY [Bacteroidota bacterium]